MSCMIHVSLFFLYESYMCIMFLPVVVMTREILLEEYLSHGYKGKRLFECMEKASGRRQKTRRNSAHGHDRLGLSRGRGGQNEP